LTRFYIPFKQCLYEKSTDLLEKMPWDMALKRREIHESWLIFTSSKLKKGPYQQVANQAR